MQLTIFIYLFSQIRSRFQPLFKQKLTVILNVRVGGIQLPKATSVTARKKKSDVGASTTDVPAPINVFALDVQTQMESKKVVQERKELAVTHKCYTSVRERQFTLKTQAAISLRALGMTLKPYCSSF